MFMNAEKKRLVWDAVPTIFDAPNPPCVAPPLKKLLSELVRTIFICNLFSCYKKRMFSDLMQQKREEACVQVALAKTKEYIQKELNAKQGKKLRPTPEALAHKRIVQARDRAI